MLRTLCWLLPISQMIMSSISFMQVRSTSGVHSSKSLHSNLQKETSLQDTDIPCNMRHDYAKIDMFFSSIK